MKSNSKNAFFFAILVSTLGLGATGSLSAQVISTTVVATGVSQNNPSTETFDLEGNGPTDWVQFGVGSGGTQGFNLVNEKSGGSVGSLDTIGAVSQTNNTFAGQTENTQHIYVSYTNGTDPTTSDAGVGAIGIQTGFQDGQPSPDGTTLSFTIDFNQAISNGTVSLVGDTYTVGTATLTAALSNGNTTTTITGTPTGSPFNEEDDVFTIDLNNITAGSSLSLSWDLTTGVAGDAYSDLGLDGVALNLTPAAIPEPSTYAMMFGGLAALIGVQRLRRRSEVNSTSQP